VKITKEFIDIFCPSEKSEMKPCYLVKPFGRVVELATRSATEEWNN